MIKKKVLMAMSGGLDSSITAVLLRRQGYDLIGITLRIYNSGFRTDPLMQSIKDAQILAKKLDIPHYIIDVAEDFKDTVIDYFIEEYQNGKTPNPCALCNYHIKWKYLIQLANEFDCEYIATGHYAQVKQLNGRYFITEGTDESKDQSYFLWRLSQEYLKRTLFPLGMFSKKEVKEMAEKEGYKSLAAKKESYDVCFIPEGNYRDFLKSNTNSTKNIDKPGNFINTENQIIGQHKGISNYTIGQRKGLGIAYTEPLYVINIDTENNQITLGTKQFLNHSIIYLKDYILSKYAQIPEDKIFLTKIRYRSKPVESKITMENDKLKIEFLNPVSAPTPGQSAVIYEGNDLVAGGVII